MSKDTPPPIRYTSRVKRGFGYILSDEEGTAQQKKDGELACDWMRQEWAEQEKWDAARKAATSTPEPPDANDGRGHQEVPNEQ